MLLDCVIILFKKYIFIHRYLYRLHHISIYHTNQKLRCWWLYSDFSLIFFSFHICFYILFNSLYICLGLRHDGLVISVSASHMVHVGRGFASRPGDTKDHQKMVHIASLHGMHALGYEFDSAVLSKRLVVCGTVYGDMHLKDLLGSIARVGYCILLPDFYLVLHGLHCQESTIMD